MDQDLTNLYIKIQPKNGPFTVLPASTEAHFLRKNSRSTENEKVRILKPTLQEIRAHYPDLFHGEEVVEDNLPPQDAPEKGVEAPKKSGSAPKNKIKIKS